MPAYSGSQILTQHDVLSIIFEHVPLLDLSRIRGAHPSLRIHVEDFLTTLLKCHLVPFIGKHTNAFLREMQDRESVLSGSVLLHLVLHATIHSQWIANDADIYCPLTTASALIDFLTKTVGFAAQWPEPFISDVFPDYPGGITAVVHLYHGQLKPIDVVVSSNNTPTWPIAHFWNTFVMNYASPRKICIAYPLTTLCGRGMVNPTVKDTERTEGCINKYRTRRIRTVSFGNCTTPHSQQGRWRKYCPATFRHFNDSACLQFDLAPSRTIQHNDPLTAFPMEYPFWSHGALACSRNCGGGTETVYGVINPQLPDFQST